jgi:hypothetical protein
MASVEEYANWRGVSPQRVRAMLRNGEISGRRAGERQWVVDDLAYSQRKPIRRALGPVAAWAVIDLLSGEDADSDLSPLQLHRARNHRDEIVHSENPAPLIHSLLRQRGERLVFRGAASDVRELIDSDKRILVSGISDPRSGVSAGDLAEVWVRDFMHLSGFLDDWLLQPDPRGNVVVHGGGRGLDGIEQVPIGLVAADLADWNGPREDSRAEALVRSLR